MDTAFAKKTIDFEGAKVALSDALDEGTQATRRAVRHGIRAIEELDEDARSTVRHHPRTTVALTFGVAMGAGLVLGWLLARAHG